jgi:hypothetical protein
MKNLKILSKIQSITTFCRKKGLKFEALTLLLIIISEQQMYNNLTRQFKIVFKSEIFFSKIIVLSFDLVSFSRILSQDRDR